MAKSSVLGHPNNVPRLAREGFNLNQVYTFTASTGMLLPVWYDLLNPGETIKGAPSFLLRSDAFLAPAMADIDCFCDLFFVPMQKILSPFGEWFYQIDDLRSDFLKSNKFTEYLPICTSEIDDKNPFSGMDPVTFNDYPRNQPGAGAETYGFGLHRLMQHLGYNPQSLFYSLVSTYSWQDEDTITAPLKAYEDLVKNVSCPNFSPYLFCAYQGIYYDYYRNSEFEVNNVKAYNLDSYFNGENSGEIPMDTVLAYGDSLGRQDMFSLRYRWRSKDYFTSPSISPLASTISMLPNGLNLLENVNQWLTQGTYDIMTKSMATSSVDPNDPALAFTQFGINTLGNISLTGSPSGSISSLDIGSPVYPDDFSASAIVMANSSTNGDLTVATNGNLQKSGPVPSGYLAGQIRTPHSHSVEGGDLSLSKGTLSAHGSAILTTARLRTMFALEKLQRITARAGKHYDDQTLAHFGFKVNQGMSGEVYKIGSWHTQLGIQKVTSTSDTQGAALGDMAAVGYAVLDARKKGFKFTAPCHGIVMCIWSCAPRYKYVGTVDKLGMKTKLWDFYKPSLDNLGKQPIFGYEFGGLHGNVSAVLPDYTSVNADVEGWQWRFMESKVKYNKASYVFMTNSKNPWSMTSIATTLLGCPFVRPTDLNKLFNAEYDDQVKWPEEGEDQDHHTWVGNFIKAYLRDPFTIDFFMKCSKVSTMSMFGDVSLNGI